MKTFKEWLIEESRFKGLHRQYRAKNSNAPAYVVNQMYNAVVSPSMKRVSTAGMEYDSVSDMMQDNDYLRDTQFPKKARIVRINPLSLDDESLMRLKIVRFGLRPMDQRVRNDTARFNTQRQLASKKGEGHNEPIILVQIDNDHYSLLDGYHRISSYFLQGAPAKDIEAVRTGNFNDVNFSQWKSVTMMAFVGQKNSDKSVARTPKSTPAQNLAATVKLT